MPRRDPWESVEETAMLDQPINFVPDWGPERPRRHRRPEPIPPIEEPLPEPVLVEECIAVEAFVAPEPVAAPVLDPVVEQARAEAARPVIVHHNHQGPSGLTLGLAVACSLLSGGLLVALLDRAFARPVAAATTPQPDTTTRPDASAIAVLVERAEAAAADARAEVGLLKGLLERERSASQAIAERLTRIEEGINAAQAGHAAEIKILGEKVSLLERDARRLEPIPVLVQGIKDDLTRSVEKIEGRLTILLEERRWKASRQPYTEAADPADLILKRGASLYARRDYVAAREVFLGLTEAFPSDARGWYYAALANAFVTCVWSGGQTHAYFEKGAECERRGETDCARIDVAFANLVQPTGKDWLAFYRPRDKGAGPAP